MLKSFCVFLLTCSVSVAQAQSSLEGKRQKLIRYQLLFAVNVSDFDYREDLPAPLKSTEKGLFAIPAIQGRAYFPQLNESFLNTDLEYSGRVSTKFDGSTQSGIPVVGTNTHVFFRGEIDFYWHVSSGFHLYTGYGYRYWDRFLVGGSGYKEIYTWNYFPFGFYLEFPTSSQFQIGVDVAYWVMTNGKLKVIFSETVSGGDDTNLELGNLGGYRIRIPMEYKRNPETAYSFVFSPWYEVSQIGDSPYVFNNTIGGPIKEPSSTTVQIGLILGLKKHF